MPWALWTNAQGELATGQKSMAWGNVHRCYHDHYCDLIVKHLRYANQPPDGRRKSALDDWLLFDNPTSTDQSSIQRRLRQSQLCPGQWLTYLKTGLGSDRTGWIGFIASNGDQYIPLDELRLIGPRMPVFSRVNGSDSPFESSVRWSRQSGALGETVFQKVHHCSVMLIGAGRLGGLMAESLVRSGVQKLIIVDPDQIESHNLDATFGTRESDLGRLKVERLVEHLHQIHSHAHLIGLPYDASHQLVFQKAKGVDLLVSCVDNREARQRVATIAARLVRIHLDLGTIVRRHEESTSNNFVPADLQYDRELGADVRLMQPGCCVRCLGPVQTEPLDQDSDLESETLQSAASWQRGGRTGSLISLNSMTVGTAMQMWLDFLAGKITRSFWHRMRWEQGQGIVAVSDRVLSPGNCKICETN